MIDWLLLRVTVVNWWSQSNNRWRHTMRIGVDYYPEHWPEERWETDAQLMAEAGISVVRVGEFAWSRFEPRSGDVGFAWLDRAVSVLATRGIGVVMGTPTATPPQWLCSEADAEGDPVYQVDHEGRRRGFGTRRHYCHNHPRYRQESERMVRAQAEHYAGNPAIIAWQLDNEFGCHDTTVCFCDHCRSAFQDWLETRYGTIDALNAAWGTVFWSQEYQSFADVIVPAFTAVEQPGRFTHNPALLLDYQRFSSDSVVAYQEIQLDVIRAVSSAPITHNFMGHFADIDYYDLAKDLDFVSWDNYPVNQWGASEARSTSMAHDITRGTKRKNFWVMEQLSGPCGWAVYGATPEPGRIRLWNYQGVAHGADAIVHFRWRPALFGTEQYWFGVLDHDGKPRRRYEEITGVAQEFAKLDSRLQGTAYPADTLILRSFDNLWSQRFQPHADGLSYEGQLTAWYRSLARAGVQCDVADLPDDASGYTLIVAPQLNLTTPELETRLRAWVEAGGTLVLTFRSGTRTWENAMRTETIPGPFADMAGVEVEEFDALSGARSVSIQPSGGAVMAVAGTASIWMDVLHPGEGTEVIATYSAGPWTGRAAITRHSFGRGSVVYVGCDLDDTSLAGLAAAIARESGAYSLVGGLVHSLPDDFEAAFRARPGSDEGVLFLLNHSPNERSVELVAAAKDALGGETVSRVRLGGFGVAVLEVSRK
jgi:beta-galactosidase